MAWLSVRQLSLPLQASCVFPRKACSRLKTPHPEGRGQASLRVLGLQIVLSLPSLDARLYIVNAPHMTTEQPLIAGVGVRACSFWGSSWMWEVSLLGQTGAGSRAPFQLWHLPPPPRGFQPQKVVESWQLVFHSRGLRDLTTKRAS